MSKSKKGKSKVRISLPFVLLFFVLVVLCWLLYSSLSAGSQSNETSIATQTTVTTASTQTSTQHTTAATTAENSTTVANTAAPANATVSEQSDNNDATDLYLNNFKAVPSDSKISASDISVGLNILVNNDYAYNFDQSTDFIRLSNLPNRAFKIMFDHITADNLTANEFNLMTKDFRAKYTDYLGVCSGYRSYATQEKNFNASVERVGEKETLKWYTRPGYSEHHTGYAIDFNTNSYGDTAFTGTGNQKWFKKNCHKYGFILRYTAEKQDITGVNPEAWHFRQVGIPHADYIMKNGICYEEYIDLIKRYSYENPLVIKADSGGTYYVYYKAMSSDNTEINLSGYSKYYYSGNNVDGFIVTAVK